MLVRLSVVLSDAKLAEVVCAMLPELDVAAHVHPLTGDSWEQALAHSDVVLASLSRLPQPVDDLVRSLCYLPSSPKLVVLADSEDPDLMATLRAAGAETVLHPTSDKENWETSLKRVIERSREKIEELFQAGSPEQTNANACGRDWLPDGWCDLPWAQLRSMLVSACEREYIDHHLTESKGRIGVVAERTGLSSRAVNLMMKRQGVRKDSYRKPKGQ